MNETLVLVGAVVGAIVIAMVITAWRIHRLQYPPELRWPKQRRSPRRKSRRPPREQDRS